MKKRLLILLVIFIFSIFFFASRAHAEERVSEHVKEAVFDTLASAAALEGNLKQAGPV
jgi:hypothetical protein